MSTANNVLSPITIYKEFTVLGCSNTSGNSYSISPSADLNDSLGSSVLRWSNIFSYGLNLGNNSINSYGNSTANSSSANGYTVLPGGVIEQWGSGTSSPTGNNQPFNFTFPTAVYNIQVTGTQANISFAVANGLTGIVVTSTAGNPTYQYRVRGK